MRWRSGKRSALGAAAIVCAFGLAGLTTAAQAQDFFSALFGSFGGRPPARAFPSPFFSERSGSARAGVCFR